jgi:hypothetical protein
MKYHRIITLKNGQENDLTPEHIELEAKLILRESFQAAD